VGAACKKGGEPAAKQQPTTEKATEATKAAADMKGGTPASADATASAGVQAGGIEHAATEGAAGMLASVNGIVEVRRVGDTTWAAAKADTKLYAGDQVRTSEGSTATIALADESTIEVAEVSTVAVASRAGTADPASSAAVLGGLARFTVTPRTPGEGAFRVYTSSGVILTKGTTYGVGVSASGEARIGVESGAVDVIGISQLDAAPIKVEQATVVTIAAEGKAGAPAPWTTDDWGTWRDEADAKIQLGAAIDAHNQALVEMNQALVDGYAELEVNADAAAKFEATAATSAESGDVAAYTAAQPEGAATIDASFSLAGRLEALTWAYAAHSALATDIYVRHPADVQAQWTIVAPRVDAAVLWPKRFEVTATAYFVPLRTQYYVHHPRGRMHAQFVGVVVPEFYAKVEPVEIDPAMVRAKVKGQIWIAPELAYHASARPVWVAAPSMDWNAKIKVMPAPPRAKVAWYVRPPTLKSTAFLGAKVTGNWQSKLTVQPPQPQAALAATWKIPVGMKIKIAQPDLSMAANARAKVKLGADGHLVRDHRMNAGGQMNAAGGMAGDMKGDMKGKVTGKLDVKAPEIKPPSVDVKAKVNVGVNAGAGAAGTAKGAGGTAVNAGADVKSKVDGAVKAGATIKAPEVKVKAPEVKMKASAKGSFKLGN
jgi:ferric-dicitrate binding protein FerR (iron transport regulator)